MMRVPGVYTTEECKVLLGKNLKNFADNRVLCPDGAIISQERDGECAPDRGLIGGQTTPTSSYSGYDLETYPLAVSKYDGDERQIIQLTLLPESSSGEESKLFRIQTSSPTSAKLTPDDIKVLNKIGRLADAAGKENNDEMKNAINNFKNYLGEQLGINPRSYSLELTMEALKLWSEDPGNKWGKGWWDSQDLKMSSPNYATVSETQYKCNAYVGEVLYDSLDYECKVYPSEEEKNKYFPPRAQDWHDPTKPIKDFEVVTNPKMGDVWAVPTNKPYYHVGIYLGEYSTDPSGVGGGTKKIYISARDGDTDEVVGVDSTWKTGDGVQRKHGIHIKEISDGGTYRRYTPGANAGANQTSICQ
jgi:hypothetical protein